MYATVVLLGLVGCAAASPQSVLPYTAAYDDGQWHPELDGSVAGSGLLRWGGDDGQWHPELDGSALGRGDLAWLNRRKRSIPLDEPVTAYAKNAHLIQQQTEATRNILGGGIPLALPADTPEVAAGKQAHAIAHENQKLATAGYYAPLAAGYAPGYVAPARYAVPAVAAGYAAPAVAAGYAAPAVAAGYAAPAVAARIAAPVAAPVASAYPYSYVTPYSVASPYHAGYGLAGLRTIY